MLASSSKVFLSYGSFLAVTGWYGAASHGYTPKTMHSLYAGLGGGLLMVACGIGGALGSPKKGEKGYKLYMIAVHVGLLFVGLFTAVFGIQFVKSWNAPEKAAQRKLFAIMGLGSAAALAALFKTKPKSTKKKE